MCNIWKAPADLPELTAAEWLNLLASPVFTRLVELDITGGEPFLRNDLVQLLEGVCRLKDGHFRDLGSVAITTNGFLTRKILDAVGAVIEPLEKREMGLVFACGMDAVGELHDRIRNYKGGWQRLHETIEGLETMRENHPGLIIGIKTTISRYNVGELDRIAEYAERHGLFTIISPFIVTASRYDNVDRSEDLEFSQEDRAAIKRFYASPRFRWSYYKDELRRFLEEGRMKKPCSAGFNYYFIRSTGDMLPCPIIDRKLGNALATPVEELMRCPAAKAFRKGVGAYPECGTCTEPGLERYALPFEGWHYLRLYFKMGREGFSSLHEHMGLDKYV
jgi:MoaA/NifB/PqqE/SkfB family radical SAM enzyme